MNKYFLKSKTILGVILSVLPALLPALGISFSAEDNLLISNAVDAIIQSAGALLAVYGRFVVKDKIKVSK